MFSQRIVRRFNLAPSILQTRAIANSKRVINPCKVNIRSFSSRKNNESSLMRFLKKETKFGLLIFSVCLGAFAIRNEYRKYILINEVETLCEDGISSESNNQSIKNFRKAVDITLEQPFSADARGKVMWLLAKSLKKSGRLIELEEKVRRTCHFIEVEQPSEQIGKRWRASLYESLAIEFEDADRFEKSEIYFTKSLDSLLNPNEFKTLLTKEKLRFNDIEDLLRVLNNFCMMYVKSAQDMKAKSLLSTTLIVISKIPEEDISHQLNNRIEVLKDTKLQLL